MSSIVAPARSSFLRRALLVDAAASGTMGLALAAGASPLAQPLGLPSVLLLYTGLFLVPFAMFLVWLARRPVMPRGLVLFVIVGNVAWILASLALLTADWVAPTTIGVALVVAQAFAVAGFAEAEYVGLRR